MARKVFNMAGGMHSAAAYSAFENAVYKGTCRATEDAFKVTAKSGMTVTVAEGDGLIDTGENFSRRVQIDAAENVTIPAADTTYDRKDLLVLFVDNNVKPNLEVIDNVNNILKLKVVQGTPAASPSEPTKSMIQSAIGATNPYMRLAVITVKANATAVTTANITDARPASPNVYYGARLAKTTIGGGYGKDLHLVRYENIVFCQSTGGNSFSLVGQWETLLEKMPVGWRPFGDGVVIEGNFPAPGGHVATWSMIVSSDGSMRQMVSGSGSSTDYQGNGAWFTADPWPTA